MKFSQHKIIACLFILPQLLVTLVFFIWPACGAAWESFFFSDAFGLYKHFAGFENFTHVLKNPDYMKAVLVTLILALWITFLTMTFGLILAMLVHNRRKTGMLYKTLLIWPYAVAPAVAALLWRFLCHPTLGWVSHILQKLGVHFNYLIYPKQALSVIIVTASWQQFSYNFLFFFAALRLVPVSLIEAAILDGASAWRRFWQIVFPLLSPTTFFLILMNLIYSFFDTFGIIHVITHGGPEYSTTTLMYKVYQDGFIGMDTGESATQSVLLMLVVIGLTLLQFRYLEEKVHYQ